MLQHYLLLGQKMVWGNTRHILWVMVKPPLKHITMVSQPTTVLRSTKPDPTGIMGPAT
ncbi:MAG: hypothetical protein IPJ13_21930 [Saprospiraceae bacterium]|nr:hypothetical protein [Saprospiraceae bacterium]